jgi:quercetin 2,3-dioxygenase
VKRLVGMLRNPAAHSAADGLPVRRLVSYDQYGSELSPFLLVDYVGPHCFEAAARARGIGPHPHRGVEKVTIVYDGEVIDGDSKGHNAIIGPGDVQWMTAGAGVMHQEFQSPAFARTGGVLEMVQVWVNLPAAHKLAPPEYQEIKSERIPTVELEDGAGSVRVIAGTFNNRVGPARTLTPVNTWDIGLRRQARLGIDLPEGHTTLIVVLTGELCLDGARIGDAEAAILSHRGQGAMLIASTTTRALVLTGAPIDEPIVGRGPFVMNTEAEIRQAFFDFGSGRFGGSGHHG